MWVWLIQILCECKIVLCSNMAVCTCVRWLEDGLQGNSSYLRIYMCGYICVRTLEHKTAAYVSKRNCHAECVSAKEQKKPKKKEDVSESVEYSSSHIRWAAPNGRFIFVRYKIKMHERSWTHRHRILLYNQVPESIYFISAPNKLFPKQVSFRSNFSWYFNSR